MSNSADHSVEQGTDKRLYEYLPLTNKTAQETMHMSGILFVQPSKFTKEVAKWLVFLLCQFPGTYYVASPKSAWTRQAQTEIASL